MRPPSIGPFGLATLAMTLVGCANDPEVLPVESDAPKLPPAAMGLLPSPQMIRPVGVGKTITWTPVKDGKGKAVDLAKELKNQPAVVVFYRGGWCPFCNRHLQELAGIQKDIRAAGFRLIAVSPEVPEALAATAEKNLVTFETYSDERGELMRKFNVAFRANEQLLPVPSLFVLDRNARVTFASSNHDYTKRISADQVIAAVNKASGKR